MNLNSRPFIAIITSPVFIAISANLICAILLTCFRVDSWIEEFKKCSGEDSQYKCYVEYPQKIDIKHTPTKARWTLVATIAKDAVYIGVVSASILIPVVILSLQVFISHGVGMAWLQASLFLCIFSVGTGLFNLFNIALKLDPSSLLLGSASKTDVLYLFHFQVFFSYSWYRRFSCCLVLFYLYQKYITKRWS